MISPSPRRRALSAQRMFPPTRSHPSAPNKRRVDGGPPGKLTDMFTAFPAEEKAKAKAKGESRARPCAHDTEQEAPVIEQQQQRMSSDEHVQGSRGLVPLLQVYPTRHIRETAFFYGYPALFSSLALILHPYTAACLFDPARPGHFLAICFAGGPLAWQNPGSDRSFNGPMDAVLGPREPAVLIGRTCRLWPGHVGLQSCRSGTNSPLIFGPN
ncbi:hypothetical protein LZ30DRAFT_811768 [Colletotrichum cereale]|nr:hypothetical protein LZ30DRAFT_811768 [Colletotrichum cereale]